MTTFVLVRHGHCDPVGKYIAGRKSGIKLSETGKKQVRKLVSRFNEIKIEAIYSSPLERAIETASPLAENKRLKVNVVEELLEIDYGNWTGKSFEELSAEPLWRLYNTYRGRVRIPGGEMIPEVVSRMSALIEKLRRIYQGTVVLVSHGDPIKSAIAHYIGVPLDFIMRLDVQPSSVSILSIDDYEARLMTLNNTGWDSRQNHIKNSPIPERAP
ncbi:MAG: phosphoglycerate mutase [Fibrobacter sp.]|jgi:broad specificity phosphatase PhoE|nr:phosphoglycerate mutase [Fibrobacter sp.]